MFQKICLYFVQKKIEYRLGFLRALSSAKENTRLFHLHCYFSFNFGTYGGVFVEDMPWRCRCHHHQHNTREIFCFLLLLSFSGTYHGGDDDDDDDI